MKTPIRSSKEYSERHPNEGSLPVASVLPWHGHAQKSDKARPLFMTFFMGRFAPFGIDNPTRLLPKISAEWPLALRAGSV